MPSVTSLSYIHEIISYILYLFFLRQVLMCSRLSLNLLYSRQQPWTFNPPASNSQGLGLQVCTTMSGLWNTGDQTLILTQASITCSHHLQFSEQASGLCLSYMSRWSYYWSLEAAITLYQTRLCRHCHLTDWTLTLPMLWIWGLKYRAICWTLLFPSSLSFLLTEW